MFYGHFTLPKKKSGVRDINPPNPELKSIQYRIKQLLDKGIRWPSYLHGGISGCSIVTNARPHVGQEIVATFDVKDFYPSTREENVSQILIAGSMSGGVAKTVSALCCYRGVLPQGAVTSTCLANLAFQYIDHQLVRLADRHGLVYTRYIDDVTLSGGTVLISMQGTIRRIIESGGYKISVAALAGRNKRQVVTGLVVNRKLRPAGKFITGLRGLIRSCWPDDLGPEMAATIEGLTTVQLKNRIFGQINHIKQFDTKLAREIRALVVKIIWPWCVPC